MFYKVIFVTFIISITQFWYKYLYYINKYSFQPVVDRGRKAFKDCDKS